MRMLQFLKMLFPERCVGCGAWGEYLCETCNQHIEYVDCFKISEKEGVKIPIYSICRYQSVVRQLMWKYKYAGCLRSMSSVFEKMILDRKEQGVFNRWIEERYVVVTIPMYSTDLNVRGFNSSKEIGLILARVLGLEYADGLLRKRRRTLKQSHLSKKERSVNVRGSYEIVGSIGYKKNIVIVDDVYTTGSTIFECAKTLSSSLEIGIVEGFTVARG